MPSDKNISNPGKSMKNTCTTPTIPTKTKSIHPKLKHTLNSLYICSFLHIPQKKVRRSKKHHKYKAKYMYEPKDDKV